MKQLSPYKLLLAIALLVLLTAAGLWAQPAAPPPTTPPAPTVAPEAVPAPAEAVPSEAPRIVAIDIVGNERIPQAEIAAQINSKVGDPYDPDQVEKDRTASYGLGWFSRVEATTSPAEGGVRLTFRVVENEVINGVEILGVTVAIPNQAGLLALMKTKPGQVANQNFIAQDIAAIEDAYAAQGYIFARVAGKEITETGVLRLTILEGKIVQIRITGNTTTKTYVVERELRSKPGQVFNGKIMQRDLERLWNLGFFEDVRYRPEVGPDLGTVIIVIEVVERKRTGLATFGGGWGSVQGFVGFVDVSKDNWRGTGQRVSVKAQFGGVQSYEAAYYNPWVAPNHTSLNIAVYDRLTLREAFVEDDDSFSYDERRIGGGVTLSRPFGEYTRGFVTLRHDELKVENVDESQLDDVTFKPQTISSISFSGVRDTRNIVANPTKGNRGSVVLELAGLFGGASFTKGTVDLRHYISFGKPCKENDIAGLRKRKVLAFRLLAGGITDDPPFLELFLAGGSETLRGYQQDRFPGKYLAIVNAEFRVPINDTVQGVLFVDFGDAWAGQLTNTLGDTSFKLHADFGIGVRVQSPIGPLRLDYGIGSDGGQLQFGMGQMF